MAYQVREHSRSRFNGDDPIAAQRTNGGNNGAAMAERPRLFSGVLPDGYAEICRAARSREFMRGEMLHIEDNAVERIFLLTSGSAKITKLGRGGEQVIVRLAGPGDILGMIGLFSCGTYCTTAQAFRPCRALVWDARVFKGLVERFPVLNQNMVAILGQQLTELEDRFREVASDRVGPRVALQLLRLLKTIGHPVDVGVEVGLSREELAQMTGTTLFTVSRLLSAWEARGVVRPRREGLAVCDVESLRAISEQEE
jgi:CRP/FNR family transcriptional regulator, nitrogen oxide reductase regulator